MREIKFRAWDGKSMLDVPINHSGYRLNELLEGICDNYKLMQYTGLQDKNGVEIYEGDILRFSIYYGAYYGEEEKIGVVEFGETGHINDYEYGKHYEWLVGKESIGCAVDHPSCTIIGNLYENPELLR